jgi:hypothetical protein
MYGAYCIILYYNQQMHKYIITVYAVEPLLSGLRLTVPLTGMQFLSIFSALAEL